MFDFYIAQVLGKMGVFEQSMFGCFDCNGSMDQRITVWCARCVTQVKKSDDIQGRFDAISDQIMNLDVKVGDQVEMDGNW